ncbi:hypothetical protein NKH18_49210 [Streptomyces sp. M10(2022)]
MRSGLHVSSPSILLENRDWLNQHTASYAFVDPEIGPMGRRRARRGSDSATSTSFPTTSPPTIPLTCPMSGTATSCASGPCWWNASAPSSPAALPPARPTPWECPDDGERADHYRSREADHLRRRRRGRKSTLAARLHQALNDAGHTAVLIGKHSVVVPRTRSCPPTSTASTSWSTGATHASPKHAATTTGCWPWPPGTPCRTASSSSRPSPRAPT